MPAEMRSDLWTFSTARDGWIFKGDETTVALNQMVPAPRSLLSSCGKGHVQWLFGGFNFVNSKAEAFGDLWVFHALSAHFRPVAIAQVEPQPSARHSSMMFTDPLGNPCVFGGQASATLNDLWLFDRSRRTWICLYDGECELVESYPAPRAGAAIWTDELGRIWMFGGNGRDPDGLVTDFDDLWRFEFDSIPSTGGSEIVPISL